MEIRAGIEETGNPEQGRVLTQFELTPKRIEQARDLVISNLDRFASQRQNLVTKWIMCDRAYRALLEPPRENTVNSQQVISQEGRSYVGFDDKASPLINDNIEAIKARLKESIIPINKKYVKLVSESIPQQLSEIRTDQLNKQFEEVDITEKVEILTHNLSTFGTSYISVPLINDEKSVLTRQIVSETRPIIDVNGEPVLSPSGEILTQEVKSAQVINEIDRKYLGPGYEPVKDNEDIYLDMFIQNIQEQPIVIQKYTVGWDHLMEGVEKGIYFEDAIQKIKDKTTQRASESSTRSERITSTSGLSNFAQNTVGEAAPHEYIMYKAYCDFSVLEDENNNNSERRTYKMFISVIDNEVVEFRNNPYFHQLIPLIKVCYMDIPGEAYGLGAIDTVLDLYHEYNDTMNQINDSKVLALNPIKIVAGRSAQDKRDLDIFPGVEWVEKQPGDIRFASFDFGPVSNGLQYLELLEGKINRGMGITKLMQGMGDQSDLDQTKGGVFKVIDQADKKFRKRAKSIENKIIKEWAEMAYKVNVQFTPVPMQAQFKEANAGITFEVSGVDNFFDNLEQTQSLISFTQQAANIPGFNLVGTMMQIADNLNIKLDEKYGQFFNEPPPPVPEEKPLNVSVTLPIDMTKGTLPAMAGAQVLAQKGIFLDLDAIGEAGSIITNTTPDNVKEESGILPQEKKRSVHRIRSTSEKGVTKKSDIER